MTDQGQKADQLVREIRERLADLWSLDLPEAEKRRHLEEIAAVIATHYLSENDQ